MASLERQSTIVPNYLTSFDADSSVVFSCRHRVATTRTVAYIEQRTTNRVDTQMDVADGRARFNNKGPHVVVVPPSERQPYCGRGSVQSTLNDRVLPLASGRRQTLSERLVTRRQQAANRRPTDRSSATCRQRPERTARLTDRWRPDSDEADLDERRRASRAVGCRHCKQATRGRVNVDRSFCRTGPWPR